jgi:ribosome-binding factor A
MNEIKRLRLQNQIYRHVATYYQKMSGARMSSFGQENEPTVEITADAAKSTNPFVAIEPENFTEKVSGYCTFTRCELAPDGSFAKIFVSIWGDEREQERIMKDIQKHAHGMRSSIAKHIRMRAIPHLAFVQDRSFEKADQVNRLIN